MLNCILYVMLTYARQTANIYFDESLGESLDLLKRSAKAINSIA